MPEQSKPIIKEKKKADNHEYRRIMTFLIIAPYKYSYLLTYLHTSNQKISETAYTVSEISVVGRLC